MQLPQKTLSNLLPNVPNVRPARRLSYVLTAAVLSISSSFVLTQSQAMAVGGSDPNLIKLENKFFQHDYAKDDVPSRLERLEKMVFGEAKSGDDDQRLKNLVAAVPNLNEVETPTASAPASSPSHAGTPTGGGQHKQAPPTQIADEPSEPIEGGSNYPAVSAIEKRVFNKDFSNEPITKRLDRLEMKAFGKTSPNAELIDRVDRLRTSTGVDVAKQAPAGSDWADDDEHYSAPKTTYSGADTVPYSPDADGKTFSGRNLRKDFADAGLYNPPVSTPGTFGSGGVSPRTSYGNGSAGTFGAGSAGTFGGGSYSSPRPSGGSSYSSPRPSGGTPIASAPRAAVPSFGGDGMPRPAPDIVRGGNPGSGMPPAAMGLSQQVSLLEKEVFQRTFQSEPLPGRLDRLEKTMYPNQPPSADKPIPSRVQRLMADVQPGSPVAQSQRKQNNFDDDMDDLDALANSDGMPPTAPPMAKSGLSRIINGLSNFFTGGMTGGYAGSTLIRDPATGLLVDQMTGNLIDPTTGVVVGSRGVPGQALGGFGTGTYGTGTYGSFGSGMSPMGGYGMGSNGIRFGFGGSGVRFGPGMILP